MPKRSNTFQKLVAYLAEKTAHSGARVRESVELVDQSGVNREVDVLIEFDAGVTAMAIAIECRDRSRAPDVEWIDQIVGKYRDLPRINKVICCANKGFSKGAKQKAELNGIEVRSPEEIANADWPAEFKKLGVAFMKFSYAFQHIAFDTDPPWGEISSADTLAFTSSEGQEMVPLQQYIDDYGRKILDVARQYHVDNVATLYATLADLDKLCAIEVPVPLPAELGFEGVQVELCSEARRARVSKVRAAVIATCVKEVAQVTHEMMPKFGMMSSVARGSHSLSWAQASGAKEVAIFSEVPLQLREFKKTDD